MAEEIVNKVAQSGLITLDLGEYFPAADVAELDIAPWLFQGLILKEKDFRAEVKACDWAQYAGKVVCVSCSADAIVPTWAYMLVAAAAKPHAERTFFGSKAAYLTAYYEQVVKEMRPEQYEGARLVIKGCGDKPVPVSAYVSLTDALLPYAKSIMYGEPCSTVPVYKKPKKRTPVEPS